MLALMLRRVCQLSQPSFSFKACKSIEIFVAFNENMKTKRKAMRLATFCFSWTFKRMSLNLIFNQSIETSIIPDKWRPQISDTLFHLNCLK